ncbi:MAG TPA: hypothetical protein VMU10_06145 [Desulfomonilia bacterium]|nr:hypothetical protein [Desulfomonilia bacterium]
MKRVLLIIGIMGFISSACLAAQGEGSPGRKAGQPEAQKSVHSREVRGMVEAVTLENLVNETRPKISIVADDGQRKIFIIQSTTTIYDPEWKPTTLDKIAKGQFVRIRYKINKDGFKVALSIKPSHRRTVSTKSYRNSK